MPSILWLTIPGLLWLLQACATAPKAAPAPPSGSLDSHRIEHVIIIAIDGLKQDTFLSYLQRPGVRKKGGLHDLLGVNGSGSGITLTKGVAVQQAVTVFPSFTYPSWTSMFTGVYPGAHGITGNNLFFRDREIARYYTEYHLDALRAQVNKNFFSDDINPHIQTLHEYVKSAGGQSIVVHNMVTRGSIAVKPDFDTLWNYQRNHSEAVDENSLWEAVHALDTFKKSSAESAPGMPTVLTLYFAGLDHVEHITREGVGGKGAEDARLAYLDHLDSLIAKFFAGDPAISRNHFEDPTEEAAHADPIAWPGVMNLPTWPHTLLVLASDHGHAPVRWVEALGIEDLQLIFKELSENQGLTYNVEQPSLIDETVWSKIKGVWGLAEEGHISSRTNVVATLNGGTLGLHLKPRGGPWSQRPDYANEVRPVLEHLLLTLHANGQGPEAVLYHTGTRYVVIPYNVSDSSVRLLPPMEVVDSPLNAATFPMAVERVKGLASRTSEDPSSAPDIILLADRSKQLTYANKQEWRVIEGLKKDNLKHFHSDHGHLRGPESAVPIVFAVGNDPGSHPHATICHASLVDITPTVLDALGLLPSFENAMASRPSTPHGHSLKNSFQHILEGRTDGDNLCPASLP